MRILHVEDDEDTRTLVAFILQGQGWDVVSVDNAKLATSLAAAAPFDVYLLDNSLEGDNENLLSHDLRSLSPHTPILFFSGAVFPSDVEKHLPGGTPSYLEKPSTPEALIAEILKLTRK